MAYVLLNFRAGSIAAATHYIHSWFSETGIIGQTFKRGSCAHVLYYISPIKPKFLV